MVRRVMRLDLDLDGSVGVVVAVVAVVVVGMSVLLSLGERGLALNILLCIGGDG